MLLYYRVVRSTNAFFVAALPVTFVCSIELIKKSPCSSVLNRRSTSPRCESLGNSTWDSQSACWDRTSSSWISMPATKNITSNCCRKLPPSTSSLLSGEAFVVSAAVNCHLRPLGCFIFAMLRFVALASANVIFALYCIDSKTRCRVRVASRASNEVKNKVNINNFNGALNKVLGELQNAGCCIISGSRHARNWRVIPSRAHFVISKETKTFVFASRAHSLLDTNQVFLV